MLQSPIGRVASRPMRNIETFPPKQMYLYRSLVEKKEAEFYHNIVKITYFHRFLRTIDGVLANHKNSYADVFVKCQMPMSIKFSGLLHIIANHNNSYADVFVKCQMPMSIKFSGLLHITVFLSMTF